MYKAILVPTNATALSHLARQAAVAFARSQDAAIIGLAVAPLRARMLMTFGAEFSLPSEGVDESALLADAQLQADALQAEAQTAGVRCRTMVVSAPQVYQAIVATARQQQCDLIFMAQDRRGALGRPCGGGQTRQVLLHASVPVLVFRATSST